MATFIATKGAWTTLAAIAVCAWRGTDWAQTHTAALVGVLECLIEAVHGITVLICAHLLPSDIDECEEGTSGCTQLCSNFDASYSCSCRQGYYLGEDLHTCFGEWAGCWLMRVCPVHSGWSRSPVEQLQSHPECCVVLLRCGRVCCPQRRL